MSSTSPLRAVKLVVVALLVASIFLQELGTEGRIGAGLAGLLAAVIVGAARGMSDGSRNDPNRPID